MDKYKYTQNWFLESEIKQYLFKFMDKSKQNNILEIGCYEGISSVFFADQLLENTNSSLTCVDPFLNMENNDHKEYLRNKEEETFDYNIRICKNANKICVQKLTSDIFFEKNTKTYNFIYIDGSHETDFIKRDMENSFQFLEKNGIMWMDNLRGR